MEEQYKERKGLDEAIGTRGVGIESVHDVHTVEKEREEEDK